LTLKVCNVTVVTLQLYTKF